MIYWLCILTLIAAIFLYIKVYELVNIDVLEVTIPFTCIILTNINAKPENAYLYQVITRCWNINQHWILYRTSIIFQI